MHKDLKAWGDDVALMGPEAPKNNGHIEHLIEYLLTVYKRFGDTSITCDCKLQWGASALWKRDEQKERIAELESKLSALSGARGSVIEEAALKCDEFAAHTREWQRKNEALSHADAANAQRIQANTAEHLASAIRSLASSPVSPDKPDTKETT